MFPFPLTDSNRARLIEGFAPVPIHDISFACAIRGLAGAFYANDLEAPDAFLLSVPPFHYFAGNPNADGAEQLIRCVNRYGIIMPSADGWFGRAHVHHKKRILAVTRYSFSAETLTHAILARLLENSPYRSTVQPVTAADAEAAFNDRGNMLDLSHFRSPGDFLARGIAFGICEKKQPVGVVFSSLAHESAVEVSLFVHPQHRRMGLATALAARFLIECLDRRLRPNWDAANRVSCRLGEKLGLIPTGDYEALEVR